MKDRRHANNLPWIYPLAYAAARLPRAARIGALVAGTVVALALTGRSSGHYWPPLFLEMSSGLGLFALLHVFPGKIVRPFERAVLSVVMFALLGWAYRSSGLVQAALIEFGAGIGLALGLELYLQPRLSEIRDAEPSQTRQIAVVIAFDAATRFEGEFNTSRLAHPPDWATAQYEPVARPSAPAATMNPVNPVLHGPLVTGRTVPEGPGITAFPFFEEITPQAQLPEEYLTLDLYKSFLEDPKNHPEIDHFRNVFDLWRREGKATPAAKR